MKKNAVVNKKAEENTKKGDDKKGPKPKKLPGFEDDSSDTSSVKGKGKTNANIKAKNDKKDNVQDVTDKPKKERKPRAKKDKTIENDNADKEVKHKTRRVKKSMVDVVSDDSFDLSDVVSEEDEEEEEFVVNKKNKNKRNNVTDDDE